MDDMTIERVHCLLSRGYVNTEDVNGRLASVREHMSKQFAILDTSE